MNEFSMSVKFTFDDSTRWQISPDSLRIMLETEAQRLAFENSQGKIPNASSEMKEAKP